MGTQLFSANLQCASIILWEQAARTLLSLIFKPQSLNSAPCAQQRKAAATRGEHRHIFTHKSAFPPAYTPSWSFLLLLKLSGASLRRDGALHLCPSPVLPIPHLQGFYSSAIVSFYIPVSLYKNVMVMPHLK